jgi:hypothetical protein
VVVATVEREGAAGAADQRVLAAIAAEGGDVPGALGAGIEQVVAGGAGIDGAGQRGSRVRVTAPRPWWPPARGVG